LTRSPGTGMNEPPGQLVVAILLGVR